MTSYLLIHLNQIKAQQVIERMVLIIIWHQKLIKQQKKLIFLFLLAITYDVSSQIIEFPDEQFRKALAHTKCVDQNGVRLTQHLGGEATICTKEIG